MKNKKSTKKIYIFVFGSAVMILAFFYSPWGSPFSNSKNYMLNPGVSFGEKIENASRFETSYVHEVSFGRLPNMTAGYASLEAVNKIGVSTSISQYTKGTRLKGIYKVSLQKVHKVAGDKANQYVSYSDLNQIGEGFTYEGNKNEASKNNSQVIKNTTTLITTGGQSDPISEKSSLVNVNTPTHGFYLLTTDINSIETNLLMDESGPQKTGSPGGDPEFPPIPVHDGFWFMLLLAGGYTTWKKIVQLV